MHKWKETLGLIRNSPSLLKTSVNFAGKGCRLWALSYSTGHVVPASREAGRWVLAISFQIISTGEARTIENCRGI